MNKDICIVLPPFHMTCHPSHVQFFQITTLHPHVPMHIFLLIQLSLLLCGWSSPSLAITSTHAPCCHVYASTLCCRLHFTRSHKATPHPCHRLGFAREREESGRGRLKREREDKTIRIRLPLKLTFKIILFVIYSHLQKIHCFTVQLCSHSSLYPTSKPTTIYFIYFL
jgi:hypothetical protein